MATLTTLLGPPDYEGIPYLGESIYAGTYFRTVLWNYPPLNIHLMDCDGADVLEEPVFGYWGTGTYRQVETSSALRTVEGIGRGSTNAEIEATYGARAKAFPPDECVAHWTFAIDHHQSSEVGFYFLRCVLSRPQDDPSTPVLGMSAGITMGPC